MTRPALNPVMSDSFTSGRCDVAVIGGGIVGVCAALFLAERGVRVTLCEKGEIGAEQSSRNWGFVRQTVRDPMELPLAMRSLCLWRDLKRRFGADTGFRQTGILLTTQNVRQAGKLAQWAESGREHGLDCDVLDPGRLGRFLGNSAHPFLMGLYTADDGRAEPGLAAPGLAGAARRLGVRVLTQTAVRGLERAGGAVSGVVTEHGVIPCGLPAP